MATFGLELMFETVRRDLLKAQDVVIVLIHWKLISNGFRCVPSKMTVPKQGEEEMLLAESSELLPRDWNANSKLYEIYYVNRRGHLFLLKTINLEQQMIFNLLKLEDESLASFTLDHKLWISPDYHNFKEAFNNNRTELESILERDLIVPFREKKTVTTRDSSLGAVSSDSEPLSSIQTPKSEYEPDQFAVGSGDLNPLGGGSPGMLMQDIHRHHLRRPQPGIPSNLPRGAVPPGARFDPFGPPLPDPIGVPITSPRPPAPASGGYGDPDPDYLPMPGPQGPYIP